MPELAGDAAVGLTFAAAFSCKDERPIAQEFVAMVQEKYDVRCPDHDFAQAYDTAQIVKQALAKADLKLTDNSLEADREADSRRAASHPYEGLAVGADRFLRRADAAVPRRQPDRHPGPVHQGRQ